MIAFLIDNWLWIGLIALFVAMHRGGHGCGMHGRHGNHTSNDQTRPRNGPDLSAHDEAAPGHPSPGPGSYHPPVRRDTHEGRPT